MSVKLTEPRGLLVLACLMIVNAVGRVEAQGPAAQAAPATLRSVPMPVVPPAGFQAAIAAGTRTTTGRPGPRYWQNWTDYQIRIRVIPETKRVEGSATIRFQNRSPETLRGVELELIQNHHAQGAIRLETAEITGGMRIERVAVNGTTAPGTGTTNPRYGVNGTKLTVLFGQPLGPSGTVELNVDWSFVIPQSGVSGRMGYHQDNLIYLAYFYPQMSVMDDVVGWHPDPFLGSAEFYAGFGNYQVTVEAPAGWIVMGTGNLTNAQDVLSPAVLTRMRAAEQSDTVVHVVTAADFATATQRGTNGTLSWTFRADSVRDVAYSLTRASLWDAARAEVGDRNGDGRTDYTRVDAFYRENARRWANVVRYEQHAITYLSRFTGYPYPWPHMTAVEGSGIIGGGMEYPMMTLMGNYTAAGDTALYGVTVHELAHMWVPMLVSTDERRYSWLDEGTTEFNEYQGEGDMFPTKDHIVGDRNGYLSTARAGEEGEIMRRSDYHYPGNAYVVATYYKPAVVLEALRALLGRETFDRAYHEFFDRWAYKHPYPWDFWNTFEDVSGRDLDWFWTSWYYETWLLDQAVESVTQTPQGTQINIADRGNVPMPVLLAITMADGQVVRREIPVDVWLAGARSSSIVVPGQVTRVQIDPEIRFPDSNRNNNVWSR